MSMEQESDDSGSTASWAFLGLARLTGLARRHRGRTDTTAGTGAYRADR